MDDALLRVIRDAMEPYGDDAATVEQVWRDEDEMWYVEVSPANRDAATFSAAFDGGDEVIIEIGEEVWFEVFPVRRPDDLDYIGELAAAVFAGRVEEVSGGGFARIILPDGTRVSVGTAHLPLPWKWWPDIRRYGSYATSPPSGPPSARRHRDTS